MADYNDRLGRLRVELGEAVALKTVSPEVFAQQMIQLLNGCESIKQKAAQEVEQLREKLGACRGQAQAAELMQDLVVNILAAFNRQERRRLEEEARQAGERAEREAFKRRTQEEASLASPPASAPPAPPGRPTQFLPPAPASEPLAPASEPQATASDPPAPDAPPVLRRRRRE